MTEDTSNAQRDNADEHLASPAAGAKRSAEAALAEAPSEPPKRPASQPSSTTEDPEPTSTTDAATTAPSLPAADAIDLKIIFGKVQRVVSRSAASTVESLKAEISKETQIPPANQKLVFKGTKLNDAHSLTEAGLKSGSKIMVIGANPIDAAKISAAATAAATAGGYSSLWDAPVKEEKWCELPQHKKVIEKGRPEDGWAGIADRQVPLEIKDQTFIPGLLNSQSTKVRLTFKDELQQLWIGSAKSTQKVSYRSIAKIEAQAIDSHEGYSILKMQIGAASTSNYWLYYFPSQHVAAIRMKILGIEALLS